MNKKINETAIFQKLNMLNYDSRTQNFIEIESIVISLVEVDQVLCYCRDNYVLDGPLKPSKEQNYINGVGLLQILFYEQNCIMRIYKYLTGKKLELPSNIKRIRDNRNIIIGHPDERKYIPVFDECGCSGYSFDEVQATEPLFYETIINEQEKFILDILEQLIKITKNNKLNNGS